MNVVKLCIWCNNVFWSKSINNFIAANFDLIDASKSIAKFNSKFFNERQELCLLDNFSEENKVGPNSLDCYLKIINRDLYKNLKDNKLGRLTASGVRFRNQDNLLYLDLSTLTNLEPIVEYKRVLSTTYSDGCIDESNYLPITYLNKEPDSSCLVQLLDLKIFEFTKFLIYLNDGYVSEVKIR